MERRKFIQHSVLSFIALSAGASCSSKIPQASSYQSKKGFVYLGLLVSPEKSIIRKLDLSTYEYTDTVVPIGRTHAVTNSATSPDEIYVFDFRGSAVRVNTRSSEILAKIDHTSSGQGLFHGHGIHDQEEKILWCSEITEKQGYVIRARSADDLSLINGKDYSFAGGHHVSRLPNTNILTSAGSLGDKKHFISFFDFRNREIKKTASTDYPGVHVLPISSSEVVSVSTEHIMGEGELSNFNRSANPVTRALMSEKELHFAGTSPLLYVNLNGEVRNHWDPSRKEIFQLGLGLDRLNPGGRYVTSHYSSNSVIVWENFEVTKVLNVPNPLVVVASADGSEVAVQSDAGLRIYSLESGKQVKNIRYEYPLYTLSKY
ncbi:MAG: hypothetical protein V4598_12875 [Bdellovibrionota bacterium]